MIVPDFFADDLEHVHRFAPLQRLDGAHLFLTGATGFFGAWLLRSLRHAADAHGLHVDVVVLSRDPEGFLARFPDLRRPWLRFVAGDVVAPIDPAAVGAVDHVVHAATPTTGTLHINQQRRLWDVVVGGTANVLAATASTQPRFLFVSSGAVYGRQPADVTHVAESHRGAPDPMRVEDTYGNAKRAAEHLVAHACRAGLRGVVARAFAFSGPLLPLDAHFAVGNVVSDALHRRRISIQGDGTAERSYLYAADLAVWLWSLLIDGPVGEAVNVGSDDNVSIAALAHRIAEREGLAVDIAGTPVAGAAPARYVPAIDRARALGLDVRIGLDDGLQRMLRWHRGPPR